MDSLKQQISACTICADHLPLGPRPVVQFSEKSSIAIVGQAPGTKVHASGIPWDDQSGKRLRQWLGVNEGTFYSPDHFAIVPMGFCYPGKGKSGDLPPRKECAPQWHETIFAELKNLEIILLIGSYAQQYYLADEKKKTLTETVQHFEEYGPRFFPLPHPSPRNGIWLRKNEWFEKGVVPKLEQRVQSILQL